jgi:phage terminase Nu1 subunit (DNA packaging protein)
MGEKVNKVRLAAILGKDQKTILKWQKEGMPVEKAGKRGTSNDYDTAKVIDWLISKANDTDKEMERARIRLTNAQADKTELEVQELQGNLISLDTMKHTWANILGSFRARILSMPSRLTPLIITHKDPKKIEKVIKDACNEALNELAEYDPETDKERKKRRQGSTKNSSTTAAT